MNDDRTQSLNLPLPHASNQLALDVQRIRDALIAIDAELAALRLAIEAVTPPDP